ncbi:hypothetical protein PLICRDRAFT_34434 [Plicaturopsis crispa FD-325 SS-3]|nr:hypothetical protein PLICRDRAFT_34434 [Plicaturopsis crispa FD-325 SS-3]
MQDVNVTFLVEDTVLFQVPSYFLRTHSERFRDILNDYPKCVSCISGCWPSPGTGRQLSPPFPS